MNLKSCWAMLAPALCEFFLASVAAQPPLNPQTDVGVPGEEHKKLDMLAGVWDVSLKIPIGPGKDMQGTSSCDAKWVMDGRFLRQEYSSTFMGKPLTVVRYLGFDRNKGKFVEVHFESTHTDVMKSEGDISKDGKTITCWGTHIDLATGKAGQGADRDEPSGPGRLHAGNGLHRRRRQGFQGHHFDTQAEGGAVDEPGKTGHGELSSADPRLSLGTWDPSTERVVPSRSPEQQAL
jgi:hypothetical protein